MKKDKSRRTTKNLNRLKPHFRNIGRPFRSLRWRMTLSYSLVTVAALLVVELVMMVFLMSYFVRNFDLTPENMIASLRSEWTPQMQQYFSEDPPDIDGARAYLEEVQGAALSTRPLFILGNLQLEMKPRDFLNFYYLLNDRTLVDVIPHGIVPEEQFGMKMPYDYLPGLRNPLQAALRGVEDQNLLYENVQPGNRIVGAIPVFRYDPTSIETQFDSTGKTIMDVERNLVGVIVFTTKHFPREFLPINELITYIGRSLLIFTFFAGILGSAFGMVTAGGVTKRLTKVSQAAHDWSRGDFSVTVRDVNNDEIGKLTHDLNSMAEQLENLLDRRLELTVYEERSRLARDLHDSVKQQAFAASAQLGAAKMHFEHQPEQAYTHLIEAESLVGRVRQELTDLIQELRPIEMKGKGLIPAVEEYANRWCRRNNIDIETHVRGERSLPLEVEKSLFRIIQEALANILWHSQAEKVHLVFNFRSEFLFLSIRDDGKGFNPEKVHDQGMGLKFMQERAELIGGEFIIDSQVDKGTKIIIKVPYRPMEI